MATVMVGPLVSLPTGRFWAAVRRSGGTALSLVSHAIADRYRVRTCSGELYQPLAYRRARSVFDQLVALAVRSPQAAWEALRVERGFSVHDGNTILSS